MFWLLKSRSLLNKIKQKQPSKCRLELDRRRVTQSEIFYGFLLVCGFGFLLTVIICPEINNTITLQSFNLETWGLKRLFLSKQENPESADMRLMKKRAEFTRQSCVKPYKTLATPRFLDRYTASRILVDDKRKILFCSIPKVACSNWKVVFLGLLGVVPPEDLNLVTDVHDSYQKYLKTFGRFSFREQQLRITTYKKFMFVRDPLVRLLSAFRNKFLGPNHAQWFRYVDEIVTFYNKYPMLPFNRTMTWSLMKTGISFRIFLQFLVDHRKVGEKISNRHYALYENLCAPCKVQYDYIGEFDNLETEANAIFEDLSIGFRFPLRRGNDTALKTVELMHKYLSSVPKELLSAVLALYSTDFMHFGYNYSKWLT